MVGDSNPRDCRAFVSVRVPVQDIRVGGGLPYETIRSIAVKGEFLGEAEGVVSVGERGVEGSRPVGHRNREYSGEEVADRSTPGGEVDHVVVGENIRGLGLEQHDTRQLSICHRIGRMEMGKEAGDRCTGAEKRCKVYAGAASPGILLWDL